MKSVVSIFVFLTSISAIACPDLSGTYACPTENGEPESILTVTQKVENGATYYTTTEGGQSSVYPADSKEYPINNEDQDVKFVGIFKGWCEGNVFKELVTGDYFAVNNGQKLGALEVNMATQIDANNNLTSTVRTQQTSEDEASETVVTFTCVRK